MNRRKGDVPGGPVGLESTCQFQGSQVQLLIWDATCYEAKQACELQLLSPQAQVLS